VIQVNHVNSVEIDMYRHMNCVNGCNLGRLNVEVPVESISPWDILRYSRYRNANQPIAGICRARFVSSAFFNETFAHLSV
jgi:hypothetical protein